MYATPVLCNAPKFIWPEFDDFNKASKWLRENKPIVKGLPISCYLSYCEDSIGGLIEHEKELRLLSVSGGGCGSHFSDVRSIGSSTSRGTKTPGIVPFLHCIDSSMLAYHQGQTRRGNCAVYINDNHPELLEFLEMRVPKGDINRQNLNLHHAINVSDSFIRAIESGSPWVLSDPHSGIVTSTVDARSLWNRILRTRFRTGEPYLNFIDNAKRALPDGLQKYGLNGSNLCNEIHLPTGPDRTAVCCLSSLNLELYDEWKDTKLVSDAIRFLDNVLEFFIIMAGDDLSRAVRSASSERSLGLGAMGFHSLLQKRGVSFESALAISINKTVFKQIKEQASEETVVLGNERGIPVDSMGSGRRNCHLLAIAPNSNSSLIVGCSPSIEPWKANIYEKTTRAGSFVVRNKFLSSALDSINRNDNDTWDAIASNAGSVSGLNLSIPTDVFHTANEIDQHWVIQHAHDRQEYICQGQSLNLFFPKGSDVNYVHSVHMKAMRSDRIKGLYYLRTDGRPVEDVSQQVKLVRLDEDDCLACEG